MSWFLKLIGILIFTFSCLNTSCAQNANRLLCSTSKLDLVFVVDSSGSIRDNNPSDERYDNYQLLKNFMIDVVDAVWFEDNSTRVGVVIFSGRVKNVFFLDTYFSKDQVKDAISNMEYLGGDTNTSGGLKKMANEQFHSSNGDRSDARNVAIVITDGESTIDTNMTIPSAVDARSMGIEIIVIGVTSQVNEEEIRRMSSMPQVLNENYFMGVEFTTLDDLADNILDIQPCPTTTPTPTVSPCDDSVVDLVFVIDSSGSIRDNNPTDNSYDNYNLILVFVLDIVSLLSIGPSQARVGLVIFSDTGRSIFHLNTYDRKSDLVTAIQNVEYIGGNTNTSGGLRVMLEESFTVSNGDRPNIPNVAVVIADGESTVDKTRTISDAEAAHNVGVTIYSIGITDDVNEQELKFISSPPHMLNENYFRSTDFVTLSGVVTNLIDQACPANRTIKGSCIRGPKDIVFLVDSSGSICDDNGAIGSIGCPNYSLLLSFISNIVRELSFDNNDTRIGLIVYANNAENVFYLNSYTSQFDIIQAIGDVNYKGGNTNTSGAFRIMMEQQFAPIKGDRPNADNIAIVITDGESTYDADRTISDAQVAKDAGVKVYAIGITDAVKATELRDISSNPQEVNSNYYITADFSTLNELVGVLVAGDCPVTTDVPFTTTSEPEDDDLTLAYILIFVGVVIFLVALRLGVFFFRRYVYKAMEDDKELLYRVQ